MKKILLVLSLAVLVETACAQKISDPTILKSSDQQLGLRLLRKSKKQKAVSYILMGVATAAATMAYVIAKEPEPEEGFYLDLRPAALGIVTAGSAVTSFILFSAAMKNSGKSEMLLRKKPLDETPGYELDLGMKYRRKAREQKTIGIFLLGSGALLLAIPGESSATTTAGVLAIGASTPFLVNASKNKGRATVLLKKQSIPFSYYSKPIGLNSISLSIPLSNSR